jgi:hypothetical protein
MTAPTQRLFKMLTRLAKGALDALDKWLDEQRITQPDK